MASTMKVLLQVLQIKMLLEKKKRKRLRIINKPAEKQKVHYTLCTDFRNLLDVFVNVYA
jgi:hypothetical protein